MAIKNKDGTPYKLKSPNPLMGNQSIWKDKYILHNCDWKPVSIETSPPVILPQEVAPVMKNTKPEEPKPDEPLKPEEPAIVSALEESNEPDDGRIEVWCYPAHIKEHVDKLYGQKFNRIKYGKTFKFEALVMEEDDIYMVLWTNTRAVTVGSVIFPQNLGKRWWRVNEIAEQNGGYNLMAVACDFTPEFSSSQ